MSCTTCCKRLLLVLPIAIMAAPQLQAQTILPKPQLGTPTVIVGPASLYAVSKNPGEVFLAWPPVAGAEKYRITRIENTGDPEITIAEGISSWFATPRSICTAGAASPTCSFSDVSTLRTKTKLDATVGDVTEQSGVVYPHNVLSGKLYTYRVWAIFPGPLVSPPSPPATVQAK